MSARFPRSAIGVTDLNGPIRALGPLRLRHKFDFLQLSLVFHGLRPSAGFAGTSSWGNRRSSGPVRTAARAPQKAPKRKKAGSAGRGGCASGIRKKGGVQGDTPRTSCWKRRRPMHAEHACASDQTDARRTCAVKAARVGTTAYVGHPRHASGTSAPVVQHLAERMHRRRRRSRAAARPVSQEAGGYQGATAAEQPPRPRRTARSTHGRRNLHRNRAPPQAATASRRRRACYLPWAASMPALRPNVIVRPAARPVIRLG